MRSGGGEAVRDSKSNFEKEDREPVGVVTAAAWAASRLGSPHVSSSRRARGAYRPLLVPMMIPDMACGQIAINYGLRARTTTRPRPAASARMRPAARSATSCTATPTVMVAGAAGRDHQIPTIAAFWHMGALSQRNSEPERPPVRTTGTARFVMRAGIFVLEELSTPAGAARRSSASWPVRRDRRRLPITAPDRTPWCGRRDGESDCEPACGRGHRLRNGHGTSTPP